MDAELTHQLEDRIFAVSSTQQALRKQHLRGSVEEYRFNLTWHHRPLLPRWVKTIGGWGGVWAPFHLREQASATHADLYAFKTRHSLLAPTMEIYREQWDVAREAFVAWQFRKEDVTVQDLAASIGILPIEARIYNEHVCAILVELGAPVFKNSVKAIDFLQVLEERWEPHRALIHDVVTSAYTKAR